MIKLFIGVNLLTFINPTAANSIFYNDLKEINPDGAELSTQTVDDTLSLTTNNRQEILKVHKSGKIAIIIDDIGYSYDQGLQAMNLPGALTYAIIPHSPKAHFFANEARKRQKETILHAPMSTIHDTPLGQYGLSETMNENNFKATLDISLDSLPNISGVNNHMGSLLTQKPQPMQWVMQALQKRTLYFIDSRTTPGSVAWKTAQDFDIPSLKRDVFLDHTRQETAIDKQFKRLVTLAKKRGYAIAIGHPYPETIAYLKKALPALKAENIELVPTSELVKNYSPNLLSQNTATNTQ